MRAMALSVVSITLLSACSSVRVDRVPPDVLQDMHRVCIERNSKVIVSDFLPVVQDGFRRHGIETAVYDPPIPVDCQFVLTYTARQGWDLVNYLKYAELILRDRERTVGSAEYRHRGGFASSKFANTYTKISPVVDELLSAAPAVR
jgi:hypothetical protein